MRSKLSCTGTGCLKAAGPGPTGEAREDTAGRSTLHSVQYLFQCITGSALPDVLASVVCVLANLTFPVSAAGRAHRLSTVRLGLGSGICSTATGITCAGTGSTVGSGRCAAAGHRNLP